MKLQLSQQEENEPAENTENTEKLGISIFTLAMENLQFNCDQCNSTNSSEKGWQQHMWMNQNYDEDFKHYYLIIVVGFIKKLPEGQDKCEERNWKCNMENVQTIIIWNLNIKYYTTTDHMKIHTTKNPYHCCLCAKKIHLQEPHEES